MTVGLISDVHGNSTAFDRVLEQLEKENAEKIIFLGDMVGYYPNVEKCMQRWNTDKFVGIRGNHDQVMIDAQKNGKVPVEYTSRFGHAIDRALQNLSDKNFKLLSSLPVTLDLEIDGIKIKCFHGAPWDFLEGRVYPDFQDWARFDSVQADLILLGHTHYQMSKALKGKRVVNPGSVGQPRDLSSQASFGLLNTSSGEVSLRRINFDASELIEDAKLNEPDVPYLHEVFKK